MAAAQSLPAHLSGSWRGEFTIRDSIRVPFNFTIDPNGKVTLLNGEEKYEAGTIRPGKDSLLLPLDQFDNEISFKFSTGTLTGILRKQDLSTTLAPVKATKSRKRFIAAAAPAFNISGRYAVTFKQPDGDEDRSVGIFKQDAAHLSATFLKTSGDARYLEGIVEGNRFYLSSFIGSTPAYYRGTISATGQLQGEQLGIRTTVKLYGQRDSSAELPDAFSLTGVKDSAFVFSLPDINGKMVSLADAKYKNKPVIIAVTGTWCPNCIDEARFLSPWYQKNRDRGVEVIAVHFERQADTSFTRKVMRRYRERFGVQYEQLFGGTTAEGSVLKALPSLADFHAYPTTIFIGRDGKAAKVHTGFSGPATGKYYDEFIAEFNREVDSLLAIP